MSCTDTMTLELRPRVRVGCFDWEKEIARELGVTLTLWLDCREAGKRDDLSLGLDYEPLVKRLVAFCEGRTFDLVEAVAEGVARITVEDFAQSRVRVAVSKRESLTALDAVTITIERGTDDYPVEA